MIGHCGKKIKKPLSIITMALLIMSSAPFILNFTSTHTPQNQIVEYGGTRYYDGAGNNGAGVQVGSGDAWAVSVTKEITDTVNGIRLPENEFEITLKVETKEDTALWEFSPDTAVVLTIDVSGSMANSRMGYPTQRSNEFSIPLNPDGLKMDAAGSKDIAGVIREVYRGADGYLYAARNAGDDYEWYRLNNVNFAGADDWAASGTRTLGIPVVKRRIYDVKNAALNFIRDYAGSSLMNPDGTTSKRYLSIVIFGQRARVIQRWIDVASADNMNTAQSEINRIGNSTSDGTYQLENATFLEGGLQLARNLYSYAGNQAQASLANRFVVLLTDGNTNCYLTAPNTRNPNSISIDGLTANVAADETAKGWAAARPYARTIADEIKYGVPSLTASAKIYTIAYNTSDEYVNGANEKDRGTTDYWLRNQIAYNQDYHKIATVNLDLVFESINRGIHNWTEAWQVVDPIGSYMRLLNAGNLNALSSPVSLTDGNRLVWNLLKAVPTSTNSAAGVTTFSYSYRVRLDNLAPGFVRNSAYETNGQTTLTYVTKKVANGIETESGPIKAAFMIPKVKGFASDLSFTKVSSVDPGVGLSGIIFNITTTDDPAFLLTTASDGEGIVRFSGIPSGHEYTLSEVNPKPVLFREAGGYAVTVDWEVLTVETDEYFGGNEGVFINQVTPVPVDLWKYFSNADGSLSGVGDSLICGLEEHIHTDDCIGWINKANTATASSLTDIDDATDWEAIYICGKQEHVHTNDCFINDSILRDEYTFTFTIRAANSSWSDTRSLTVPRSTILTHASAMDPYIVHGFFTIPADQIDNGPFSITESDAGFGWIYSASELSDTVDLDKITSLPAVAVFHNEYGSATRPWLVINKHLTNTSRGEYDGVFRFGLYYDEELKVEATSQRISVSGADGYKKLVMLDEYGISIPYDDAVVLYLAEIDEGAPGMTYDRKVYSISIYHGAATIGFEGVNSVEGGYVVFENSYYKPLTPEFTIRKITAGGNGSFRFYYQIGENTPVRTEISTSGNSGARTITLPTNFTGTVKIWEDESALPGNWTADEPGKTETLRYEDGALVEYSEGAGNNGTAVFSNTYKPPTEQPPDNNPTPGNLIVTKAFTGVNNVPNSWSATIRVTGPGGYSETRTITGSNRTAAFNGLTPGEYTVTEIDPGGIAGYAFVSVSIDNDGVCRVRSDRTTNVTVTNRYEPDSPPPTTPPPATPPPVTPPSYTPPPPGGSTTITEEGPPLSQFPPETPPDEYVEIPQPPVPLGEMPPTGIQDSIVLWFYGICALMLAIGFILRAIYRIAKAERRSGR